MAGTIVVDRIESDASYASNINVASQVTFSNTVNMTVASTFPAGTVGAPSITTSGDTNTGIFFPAADTIAFVEGGVEAMRIDSSGNLLVGSISTRASAKLDVRGETIALGTNASFFGTIGYNASTGLMSLAAESGGGINFLSGITESARIDSSGNLQFNSGFGSVATAYAARAWVNFNGAGTVAIRASGNVSSITDNGVGDYTVNFTTAMPDANYSAVGTAGQKGATWGLILFANTGAFATSGLRLLTQTPGDVAGDTAFICVAIFR